VGSNPWNEGATEKNLASLAEKYGGGGHPRVAAISFDPGDLDHARKVARELVETLRS
jgi:nanoRNase/pAp phosphatase (c-di-AMP/oligoRNAs hydrolase)